MANSAGNSGARRNGEWRPFVWGVLIGLAIVALLAAAFAIGHNRGRASTLEERAEAAPAAAEPAPPAETPAAQDGAGTALFQSACGACHTLVAAGTQGMIGPNLDDLAPTLDQVLAAIANGGSGSGQMPAGLLEGAEAQQVAELVGAAAGG